MMLSVYGTNYVKLQAVLDEIEHVMVRQLAVWEEEQSENFQAEVWDAFDIDHAMPRDTPMCYLMVAWPELESLLTEIEPDLALEASLMSMLKEAIGHAVVDCVQENY